MDKLTRMTKEVDSRLKKLSSPADEGNDAASLDAAADMLNNDLQKMRGQYSRMVTPGPKKQMAEAMALVQQAIKKLQS